jgi:dihydroorotate dehydrogenase
VPSFDPEFWQPDLADAVAYAGEGQVVVGSFQGTKSERGGIEDYIADFVLGARLLRETGVKIVEVNLSCPNEGTSALLCFDVERSRKVVEAIKSVLGEIPLLIKVAYFRDDASVEELVRAVSGTVSGIVAINTISAEIVDEHGQQALPGEGRLRSGVCGTSIKWAGLEMTRRLKRVREVVGKEITIIGCGGVSNAADYEEYLQAGADAVMSATAMMWNPLLAQQIKREAHEL